MEKKEYFSKVKKALTDLLLSFNSLSTDKAELFWNEDTELMVGYEVFIEGENGKEIAPDGEYISDSNKIKVEGGKVTEIEAKEGDEIVTETKPEEVVSEEMVCGGKKKVKMEEVVEEPVAEIEVITEPTEPVAEVVVEDEKDKKIKELEDKIKELEGIISAKDAEIVELKTKLEEPAVAPVTEEFNAMGKMTSIDKSTDSWIRIAQSLKK